MTTKLDLGVIPRDVVKSRKKGLYGGSIDSANLSVATSFRRMPSELAQGRGLSSRPPHPNPSTPPSLITDASPSSYLPSSNLRSPSQSSHSPAALSRIVSSPIRTSSPFRAVSHTLATSPHSRREQRYKFAQASLASTLKLCKSEPSSTDLQIRALQRATALLIAQAQDARERATQLRECLKNSKSDEQSRPGQKELQPDRYKAIQRERWMAERRCAAREQEAKAVQGCIAQLAASNPHDDSIRRASSARSPRQRRRTNLVRFMEGSPTRVTFNLRHGVLQANVTQRRKIMHRVRPLRLRTSLAECAFSKLPDDIPNDEEEDGPLSYADLSPPPVQPTPQAQKRHPFTDPVSFAGTAHIYQAVPRTKSEILAELERSSEARPTRIPSYAVALLDELVASELDVTLAMPPSLESESPHHSWTRTQHRAQASDPSPIKRHERVELEEVTSAPDIVDAGRGRAGSRAGFRRSLHLGADSMGKKLQQRTRPSSSLSSVPESFDTLSQDRDLILAAGSRPTTPVVSNERASSKSRTRFSALSLGLGDGGVVSKFRNRFSALARR